MLKKGVAYSIGAYLIWGVFPIYWKQTASVPALQLIGHRIVWSCLTLLLVVFCSNGWRALVRGVLRSRVLRLYAVAGALISINWFAFVWAVNSGLIVEVSLGYFINPMVSVVLGVLVLRERLRPPQIVAVILAASGVLYLTVAYGSLPWIALTLALSFGSYGLVKKTAPLGSMQGLTVETALLLPAALLYLLYVDWHGEGAFLRMNPKTDMLLMGSGVVTTVPLLMFSSGVRRIPLSLVGLLQYISPTMQLLIGVLKYREPFSRADLIGYSLVWTALLIFGLDGAFASVLGDLYDE